MKIILLAVAIIGTVSTVRVPQSSYNIIHHDTSSPFGGHGYNGGGSGRSYFT